MAEKIIKINILNNEAANFILDQIDLGLEADELDPQAAEMVRDFYDSLNNYSELRVCLPPLN